MSLFREARSKQLAKIVSIKSPSEARKSAKKLLSMFRKAKTRARKVHIKKSALCASNRAKVMSKRKDLSEKERREMKAVSKIYASVVKKMKLPPKR